ncbi:hypothetical protein Tco_0759904 [Tanacetum coccineum]
MMFDPRVKVETISESTSSPPRSRRKHRGVRSDDSLWDKPVEDFFSSESESESDDDMEHYIPHIPYGAFKDWEIVRCPLSTTYYHVYYQENRRQKSFFYLKQLLPHVYREDLLLLLLENTVVMGSSSWKLYPRSSVHVLDLTNGKTVYMFVDKVYPIRATLLERMLRHRLTVPPSYCRDVVLMGHGIQTVQVAYKDSYECLASVPIVASTEGTDLGKELLKSVVVARLPKLTGSCCLEMLNASFESAVHREVHAVSLMCCGFYNFCVVVLLLVTLYLLDFAAAALLFQVALCDYVYAGHVLVLEDLSVFDPEQDQIEQFAKIVRLMLYLFEQCKIKIVIFYDSDLSVTWKNA